MTTPHLQRKGDGWEAQWALSPRPAEHLGVTCVEYLSLVCAVSDDRSACEVTLVHCYASGHAEIYEREVLGNFSLEDPALRALLATHSAEALFDELQALR